MSKKPTKDWTNDEKEVFNNVVTSYMIDEEAKHRSHMNKLFTALIHSVKKSIFESQSKKKTSKERPKGKIPKFEVPKKRPKETACTKLEKLEEEEKEKEMEK